MEQHDSACAVEGLLMYVTNHVTWEARQTMKIQVPQARRRGAAVLPNPVAIQARQTVQ